MVTVHASVAVGKGFPLGRGKLGGWSKWKCSALGKFFLGLSKNLRCGYGYWQPGQRPASQCPHPPPLFLISQLLFIYFLNSHSYWVVKANLYQFAGGQEMWTGLRGLPSPIGTVHTAAAAKWERSALQGSQSTLIWENSRGHGSWATVWATRATVQQLVRTVKKGCYFV